MSDKSKGISIKPMKTNQKFREHDERGEYWGRLIHKLINKAIIESKKTEVYQRKRERYTMENIWWVVMNMHYPLGVFKNDEVSKTYDLGIVSHGFDLAESNYVG